MRSFLREFLESEGHNVELAVNGEEGITRALAGDHLIAFCDLHMPRRNGFQVYEAVVDRKPHLNFVFTDSMPDANTDQLAASSRFIVLRKPFDLQQVRRVLQSLVSGTVTHGVSS
jgi:CheY-like chemotaxis protein